MDKETEIMHLQALVNGDTYFAQFFSKSDIERMVQNINNDFPIELGCAFVAKTDVLKKALKNSQEKAEQERFEIAVAIFSEYIDGDVPAPLLKILNEICGSPLRVIEAKTVAGVTPTREEVNFLISKAKNNKQSL